MIIIITESMRIHDENRSDWRPEYLTLVGLEVKLWTKAHPHAASLGLLDEAVWVTVAGPCINNIRNVERNIKICF